jgi:hypothetical protein
MMGYIAPLFALSGLYWQYGLVLYWVCTNLWTMGQQHYIFKKYPQATPAGTAGGQGATGTAGAISGTRKGGPAKGGPAKGGPAKGGPARTGASRTGAAGTGAAGTGAARTGAARTGAARTGAARTGAAKSGAAKGAPERTGSGSRGAASGAAKGAVPEPTGSGSRGPARSLTGTAKADGGEATTGNGQGGGFGLGRLLRGRNQERQEPETPQEAEEQPRIVRRQPVRQSRSRRTGKG